MEQFAFVPVRRAEDSSEEYFDVTQMSGSALIVDKYVSDTAKEIPSWSAANPVLRIARVRIVELP